jgi:hypothetical protein
VKTTRQAVVLAGVLVLPLILAGSMAGCNLGCELESDSGPTPYKLVVDSLNWVPQQPSVGDTLTLRFYGILGYCLTEHFTGFETYRDSLQLDVTLWAERPAGMICWDTITWLEGEPLDVYPLYEGTLVVIVHEPHGPALLRMIDIGPSSAESARPN